jgi:hypothetical protein
VTAEQYQPFVFGLPEEQILQRASTWLGTFGRQFGLLGIIFILLGMLFFWFRDRRWFTFTLLWIIPLAVYAFFYKTPDSYIFTLPAVMLLTILWGGGALMLLLIAQSILGPRVDISSSQPVKTIWRLWMPLIIMLLPLAALTTNWSRISLRDDHAATTYITQVLDVIEPGGLVVTRRDSPTFSLWYAVYTQNQRPDVVVVNGRMLGYLWYREQVRDGYPDINVPYATSGALTTDDLIRELIENNYSQRPVYATDPVDLWKEWFDFVPLGEAPVYRIQVR